MLPTRVDSTPGRPLPACGPGEQERAIPLHRPFTGEREREYIDAVLRSGKLSGGGAWMDRAEALIRERFGVRHAFLTSSCTHALEAAAMAAELHAGDEVIVPAWAFPTTASCVLRTGARVVFADSGACDPGLDPLDVRRKLTRKTRAIVALHYAGLPCDMAALREIADEEGLMLIEDAAQGFDSTLGDSQLGTLGEIGCLSFHGTKNLTCGEGGVLLCDDDEIASKLTLIRELGTDRRRVMNHLADHYTWQGMGSSFLPSEIAAAMLCAQIEKADEILERRREIFSSYAEALAPLADKGHLELPFIPPGANGNGHIFYIRTENVETRDGLRAMLGGAKIETAFHFMALDGTPMGCKLRETDAPTPECREAKRLEETVLRLPIYPELAQEDLARVTETVFRYFSTD